MERLPNKKTTDLAFLQKKQLTIRYQMSSRKDPNPESKYPYRAIPKSRRHTNAGDMRKYTPPINKNALKYRHIPLLSSLPKITNLPFATKCLQETIQILNLNIHIEQYQSHDGTPMLVLCGNIHHQ